MIKIENDMLPYVEKYRPTNIDDVIGYNKNIKILLKKCY